MGQLSEQGKMTDEIMRDVQERCKECPQARLTALFMAEKVLAGEVTLEQCIETHAREIADNCNGGKKLQDGSTKCIKGLKTGPLPPPHIRDELNIWEDTTYA